MIGSFSRGLITFGIFLVIIGFLMPLLSKVPFVGKLPGDIYFQKENFTFYFPLSTCLMISVVITLLFSFFGKR